MSSAFAPCRIEANFPITLDNRPFLPRTLVAAQQQSSQRLTSITDKRKREIIRVLVTYVESSHRMCASVSKFTDVVRVSRESVETGTRNLGDGADSRANVLLLRSPTRVCPQDSREASCDKSERSVRISSVVKCRTLRRERAGFGVSRFSEPAAVSACRAQLGLTDKGKAVARLSVLLLVLVERSCVYLVVCTCAISSAIGGSPI